MLDEIHGTTGSTHHDVEEVTLTIYQMAVDGQWTMEDVRAFITSKKKGELFG